MRIIIITLAVLFFSCIIAVAIMNHAETVTFHLWPDTADYTYPQIHVSWIVFFSAFAGFLSTGIIALLEGGKKGLINRRLRAQVQRLQQELTVLRRPSTDIAFDDPELPEASIEDEMDEEESSTPREPAPRGV